MDTDFPTDCLDAFNKLHILEAGFPLIESREDNYVIILFCKHSLLSRVETIDPSPFLETGVPFRKRNI